ncbi:hypothetical protein [Rhodococcus sp. OK302]|uniref:hypothetical protein n=1 Tax=Rhodococcus sp. OK302 TaxID=1882769 RepID=UPI0015962EA1|nr:hypothetical protein [Rhodococcus sp. OK302]
MNPMSAQQQPRPAAEQHSDRVAVAEPGSATSQLHSHASSESHTGTDEMATAHPGRLRRFGERVAETVVEFVVDVECGVIGSLFRRQ